MQSRDDREVLSITGEVEADVVVVGGGIAGIFAALGAARAGVVVVLVEASGFVGGQATAGGVHTFCGDTLNVNDAWRELLAQLAEFDGGIAPYRPNDDGRAFSAEHLKFVAQSMLTEAGVRVFLHTTMVGVQRESERASYIIVANKSGLIRLRASQFVDASGDADVVARGGWPTEKGGPTFAPTAEGIQRQAERLPLPMSLYFALVDAGREVRPSLPRNGREWENDDALPMTSVYEHDGLVIVKMKVVGFDAVDGESLSTAEHAGREQALALTYHLQTKGYLGKAYPHHRLAWMAPQIGIREGRRIVPLYELTLADLLRGARFDDAVAVGSYHIDYHWPTDERRSGTGLTSQVPPYQIPLRAMRPEGSSNLLVPGRSMGGEQIAMSSFRVMAICAQTGFGAGTAAGLAAVENCELANLDLPALRLALLAGGVTLDLAPYLSYLRSRRRTSETVADVNGAAILGIEITMKQDGGALCAWRTEQGIWLASRDDGRWAPAEPVDQDLAADDALGPIPGSRRLFGIDRGLPPVAPRGVDVLAECSLVPTEADHGDPVVRVRSTTSGPLVESSLDGGTSWTQVPTAVLDDPRGPVAMAATSGGALLAWLSSESIRVIHLSYDELVGDPAESGPSDNEQHTGTEWMELFGVAGQRERIPS